MAKILSRKTTRVLQDEKIINLGNIDPSVCKQDLLGEVTEDGSCIAKIRTKQADPDHAQLEVVQYQPRRTE